MLIACLAGALAAESSQTYAAHAAYGSPSSAHAKYGASSYSLAQSRLHCAIASDLADPGSQRMVQLLWCKPARYRSRFVLCRGWELALGRHMNLQHLHLQNLVSQSLTIRGACRVHASYTGRFGIRETVAREDRATWAGSYLWNNVGPQLSSVSVQDDYSTLRPFGSQEVGRCKKPHSSQTSACSSSQAEPHENAPGCRPC